MRHVSEHLPPTLTKIVAAAVKRYQEHGDAAPIPLDVARKMHDEGMVASRLCPSCDRPVLDVTTPGLDVHLDSFWVQCE